MINICQTIYDYLHSNWSGSIVTGSIDWVIGYNISPRPTYPKIIIEENADVSPKVNFVSIGCRKFEHEVKCRIQVNPIMMFNSDLTGSAENMRILQNEVDRLINLGRNTVSEVDQVEPGFWKDTTKRDETQVILESEQKLKCIYYSGTGSQTSQWTFPFIFLS